MKTIRTLSTQYLTPFASAALLLLAVPSAQAISLTADVGATVNGLTQTVSDATLTTQVKAKLAADASVKGSDISVTTTNGVAVLTGKAPTLEAKNEAAKLALGIEGVTKVDNQIEAPSLVSTLGTETKAAVKNTGEKITDGWITTKVKGQLLANELTKASTIKVSTKDNVVVLRGTAASAAEKAQAIKLASEIEGVSRVNASKLKVDASAKASASN